MLTHSNEKTVQCLLLNVRSEEHRTEANTQKLTQAHAVADVVRLG